MKLGQPKIPTDREIFRVIYTTYQSSYPGQPAGDGHHSNDPYLAVDLAALAEALHHSKHLLFGRLHYGMKHLEYRDQRGALTTIFTPLAGDKRHAVNFPYLVSVLAEMDAKYRRERWALFLSILSLIVAVVALVT